MGKQDLLTSGFKSTVMYGSSGEIEAVYAPFKEYSGKIKLVWIFKDTPASAAEHHDWPLFVRERSYFR